MLSIMKLLSKIEISVAPPEWKASTSTFSSAAPAVPSAVPAVSAVVPTVSVSASARHYKPFSLTWVKYIGKYI